MLSFKSFIVQCGIFMSIIIIGTVMCIFVFPELYLPSILGQPLPEVHCETMPIVAEMGIYIVIAGMIGMCVVGIEVIIDISRSTNERL